MERLLRQVISMGLFFLLMQGSMVLAQKDDEILAKVGNEVITRTDFETRLKSLPPLAQQAMKDPQKKKGLLDAMVKARLLVLEARDRGLMEKPEIQSVLKMQRDDLIDQEYIRAYLEKQIEVTDEEAENYYNTSPEIKDREYFKISQIAVENEKEAKEILERLRKGEPFKKLASERSKDPSRYRYGELDWFEKGKLGKEIEEAVQKLEKGGLSEIVRTKGLYYIFKLDDKRTDPKLPYLGVKDDIIKVLKSQKLNALAEKETEELKKKITVETFYDKL